MNNQFYHGPSAPSAPLAPFAPSTSTLASSSAHGAAPSMSYGKPMYAGGHSSGVGGLYGPHHQQQQQQGQGQGQQHQGGGGGLYGPPGGQQGGGGGGGMFEQDAGGQGQGQGGQQGNGAGNSNGAPSAPSVTSAAAAQSAPPEMTLPSILHFLQAEWRRWERERNEWEIERADMRARIALLEGLKRSSENAAADQKRRIVLLEYALKAERAKALGLGGAHGHAAMGQGQAQGQGQASSTGSPAQRATINGTGSGTGTGGGRKGTSLPDTNGGGSGAGQPGAGAGADKLGLGATAAAAAGSPGTGRASSAGDRDELRQTASAGAGAGAGWKTAVPFVARDPKARARSRDYLKQCLQEISYLTSPAALNPLPARIPLASGPSSQIGEGERERMSEGIRPEKVLSERPAAAPAVPGNQGDAGGEGAAQIESHAVSAPEAVSDLAPAASPASTTARSLRPIPNGTSADLPPPPSHAAESGRREAHGQELLTAIYKPASKAAWKEALRSANEKAEQSRQGLENGHPPEGLEQADTTSLVDDAQSEASDAPSSSAASRIWRPVRQLRSHLDSVNAIAFGPEGSVVSGSTDCTVKYWRLDVANLLSGKSAAHNSEQEPQATFRGHTSSVTAVVAALSRRKLYSASLDSAIRVWNCPPPAADTYAAYDPSAACASLVGHTDAIWALALVPSKKDAEGWLVSASADGTVKVWDATAQEGREPPLCASWRYEADEREQGGDEGAAAPDLPVPICIAAQPSQLRNVLVGYTTGVVKAFELESGKEVTRYQPSVDGGEPTAVNAIICHPTLDVLVAAYDDGMIRIFDIEDGTQTHAMPAHSGSVTSLALDASTSTQFASSGADCSVKIWDLETRTCLQEWSLHRRRGDEGVQQVAFGGGPGAVWASAGESMLCSAGGDGNIRVYTKEKEVPATAAMSA